MASGDTKTQHGAGGALSIALTHKELHQIERRKRRESERTQLLLISSAHDNDTTSAKSTIKRESWDFSKRLQQEEQLAAPTLRPLERWYYQLQLLIADKAQRSRVDLSNNGPSIIDEEEEEGDDHAAALSALEHVLAQDVACLDLRYATGASVQDTVKSLLDNEGASILQSSLLLEEILSFSTMRSGRVCRVACVRHAKSSSSSTDKQYAFHSSLFVSDFAAQARQLLLLPTSHVHSLIELAWSELSPP